MAFNNCSKRFWQIVYPEDLDEGRLMISKDFVTEYGHLLSEEAVLKVSDGEVWKIGLAKQYFRREERIWLSAGFRRFLEYYSIDVGYLLIFEFRGSSRFLTSVFDLTACEIEYPISSSSPASGSDSDFDFDDPHRRRGKGAAAASNASGSRQKPQQGRTPHHFANLSISDSDSDVPGFRNGSRGKRVIASSSESDSESGSDSDNADFRGKRKGKQLVAAARKNHGNASSSRPQQPPNSAGVSFAEDLWSKLKKSTIVKTQGFQSKFMTHSAATQRAIRRAVDSDPKNPSFLVVIGRSHLQSGNMSIPDRIADVHLMENLPKITLRVVDGDEGVVDEREVKLFETKHYGRKYICGLMSACKKHGLVAGDVCLFELVERETNLFHVRIFHSS